MTHKVRGRLRAVAVAAVTAAALTVAPAGAAHAAGTYTLLTLPDQGETQIYNFVNSATSSINMTMYELKDTTLTTDLVNREKAGVTVRVILDQDHQSYDQAAYTALTDGGVSVVWSSTAFNYTHQKTITVDGTESYITTGNLDTTYYATSRDYGVFDTDQADVAAVTAVFNADFTHSSITPSDGDNLVWSPTDSQTRLLSIINGAQHSLDIEQEEFSDTALINAIVADLNRGVTVRLVLENESNEYASEISEVEAAGATVTTYTSPTGYYIHAKTIVADYGTSTAKAFEGSENFSSNSLNDNRELGMIVSDSGVVNGLESGFAADFGTSAGDVVSVTDPGDQTGAVGTAASLQIKATDSASGQTLSYSASGLPAGLSIGSSTGLISGTPTAAGTSNVSVTAKDATGASGSTSFTWTVTGTGGGGGCTAAQALGNPGFENGYTAAPWTTSSGVPAEQAAEPPHSGSWDAWLDGYGTTHTDTLAQTVSVPATCTSASFSFWLHIDTAETSTTSSYDTLKVQVLNGSGTVLATLATFSNLDANTGYAQHTYSLAGYTGQAITLQFTGAEDYELQTSFVLDDTALDLD